MSKSDKGEGYSIGFGKPPEQHRFKKGQSGNPKGRSKKAKDKKKSPRLGDGTLETYLEQEVFRELQLQENGKRVTLSAGQAALRSFVLEGIKGGRLAKRQVYEFLRREEREATERAVERYKYWADFKAQGEALIRKCRTEKRPVPKIYPHPDDILLDEANAGVHFLGPQSADQAIPYIRGALTRDWLLAVAVSKGAYGREADSGGVQDEARSSIQTFVHLIEGALPPSFQRSDSETAVFLSNLIGLGKRQLRSQVDALVREIEGLPLTVEERLEKRKKSSLALEALSATFETVAEMLVKKEGQPA